MVPQLETILAGDETLDRGSILEGGGHGYWGQLVVSTQIISRTLLDSIFCFRHYARPYNRNRKNSHFGGGMCAAGQVVSKPTEETQSATRMVQNRQIAHPSILTDEMRNKIALRDRKGEEREHFR